MGQKVVIFLMGPFPFYGSSYFHMLIFHADVDGLALRLHVGNQGHI